MFTIVTMEGTICKEQKTILKEQEHFYCELYKSDPRISWYMCRMLTTMT